MVALPRFGNSFLTIFDLFKSISLNINLKEFLYRSNTSVTEVSLLF